MRTQFGAWIARARFAARLGRPMPTKQTAPSRRRRAAATAIISSAVYVMAPPLPDGGADGSAAQPRFLKPAPQAVPRRYTSWLHPFRTAAQTEAQHGRAS